MAAETAEKLMGRALALTRQGRLTDAERLFAEVCEQDSSNGKAWFMRGAIRIELGDTDRAIDCLSNAVGLDPEGR